MKSMSCFSTKLKQPQEGKLYLNLPQRYVSLTRATKSGGLREIDIKCTRELKRPIMPVTLEYVLVTSIIDARKERQLFKDEFIARLAFFVNKSHSNFNADS